MLSCPLAWKPVATTAGSSVREDCDGSSGGTALVATIRDVFSLSLTQSIEVPGESVLREARHLHNREHHRSCIARTTRKDIHQTGITLCEHEGTLDAMTNLVVDASYFVRFAGRKCTEGLELGTDRGGRSAATELEQCVESALKGDCVIPVLRRNVVSSYKGTRVNSQAERKPEGENQASGRLHPNKRGPKLEGIWDEGGRGSAA